MRLDGKSIQAAIMQLVDDYKFDPFQVLEIVKLGIKSGFKKDFPEHKKSQIIVNIENDGTVTIYKELVVVSKIDENEDEETQILLKDATKIRKDVEIGEQLLINVTPEKLELSRIASQAAAQTIKQNLKNIERERFYEKFQNKQGELLKARVIRVHADSVILDIEGTAVVLGPEGQVPNRSYEPGEEVFVLLKQISKGQGGIILEITQATPEYIEAILRKIVPELEEGTVIIENIARIPGLKTKIVVSSNNEQIDPVGVMVGSKGDRINTVLSLLDGEKIDFVESIGDSIQLIKNCLKPAHVEKVEIKDKKAIVHMDESQKPLAIGKGASNVKLASQITGYQIEIK
ncbi:TPA: transcription termination factor NusA [Patescibacteria group bacterium]|nr:transcription termination factor NusA [Candidatus Gracilibacteria bacterium]